MSKRQFKSHASSARVGSTAFRSGAFAASAFGAKSSSVLSYVQEPIDYATIEDPNVVVALKNLSKKDSTTKAKALEDLQNVTGGIEALTSDAFLEIWVSASKHQYALDSVLTTFRHNSLRDYQLTAPDECGSYHTFSTANYARRPGSVY